MTTETEFIYLPCLYCKKKIALTPESYEAQGIFNVFCPDNGGECEDRFAWAQ